MKEADAGRDPTAQKERPMLHDPTIERDACGIGFVADAGGRASHEILEALLAGLCRVRHRGAIAADRKTGDGAGLLLPLPRALLHEGGAGLGMVFLRDEGAREAVAEACAAEGIEVLGWREVPVDPDALGPVALGLMPHIEQALLRRPDCSEDEAEERAFRARRRAEQIAGRAAYFASFSFRTVTYKALCAADQLGPFYPDLTDPELAVPFGVFHQRVSTNTLPSWERAQPFRTLCHNGEINALWGNENRMRGRAELGTEAAGLGDEELFFPVFGEHDSDSGKLDSAVELLVRGGRDIRHAMAMVVPEAWESVRDVDSEMRGFYRYHSALMEPWDGPAGIIFTDGVGVGAALDRNGLRPLRWAVCEDGFVAVCSEVGAVDLSGHGGVRRGRLGPGQMLFVDPTRGFLDDEACKERIAAAAPYAHWAADGFYRLPAGEPTLEVPQDLTERQAMHGYTKEELAMIIKPMVADAYEPTFSM